MRRASAFTVSTGTSHRLLVGGGGGSGGVNGVQHDQDPIGLLEPPPLPPKRSTSLLGATTLFRPKLRDKSALNPKRVSVATSTFWEGHPELGQFMTNWETGTCPGRERLNSDASVWGTTERGESESVNLWGDPPAVKKGILLQQREKLLARWKERYCILTRDYLHCFRRTTSIHRRSGVRLSEMGNFIFKMRLADVEEIEWETRRGVNVTALVLPQEPKIFFKVPGDNAETLRQWYTLLQECIYTSKERRQALRTMHSTTSRSLSSKSEGSPVTTTSSSSSDKDSVQLRRNIAKISLNMSNKTDGQKYSPIADKRKDYYDTEDHSRVKVTLRRDVKKKVTTLEEFMNGGKTDTNHRNNTANRTTIMGTGYSFPIDTTTLNRPTRPDSWTPQQVIYRTPLWVNNKRDDHSTNTINSEFCPSRHTSEITFRKMC